MNEPPVDLLAAAAAGDLSTLQATPSIDEQTMQSIACAAAKAAQLSVLEYALTQGASLQQNELVVAALDSSAPEATLGCLLDKGLDPDHDLSYLGTPLLMAVHKSNVRLTHFLLSKGAKPDTGTFGAGRHTALSMAAARGDMPITRALLDGGAPIQGSGALQTAAKYGRQEVVLVLLESGADPNEVLSGQISKTLSTSALGEAAKAGKMDVVKLLLDHGAKTDVKGSEGKTVLEVAEGSGHRDIYEVLWNRD